MRFTRQASLARIKQIMKQRKPHRNERTQGKQLWKKLGIIKIQIIDNNEEWLTDVFKAHLISMTICG